MKLIYETCPICKKKLASYNAEVVRLAMNQHISRTHPQPKTSFDDTEHPYDFSHSGLGIGGLATYQEEPPVPTVAQMERLERMEARATRCRRCGQTDVFDGAMFTTVGGDICDDCCG